MRKVIESRVRFVEARNDWPTSRRPDAVLLRHCTPPAVEVLLAKEDVGAVSLTETRTVAAAGRVLSTTNRLEAARIEGSRFFMGGMELGLGGVVRDFTLCS